MSSVRSPVWLVAVAAVLLAMLVAASAQRDGRSEPPAVSRADEKRALEFAKEHHPELVELLKGLRTGNEREYRRAVRQLVTVRERLQRLAERDEERHRLQLEAWKLDSRLQLLAARMSMSDDPALEEQLRNLVRERVAVRRELLAADRERLEQRLQRIEKQLRAIEGDVDGAVERELARIRAAVRGRK